MCLPKLREFRQPLAPLLRLIAAERGEESFEPPLDENPTGIRPCPWEIVRLMCASARISTRQRATMPAQDSLDEPGPEENIMGSAPHFSRMLRNAVPRQAAAIALALLAVSAVLAPPASAKSDEVVRAPSGVMYVTGGVDSEAVDRLKSMERDFNLKLVFANTSGAYLGDVKVTIVDASGNVVLDATSEGPQLMAKLPTGGYRVDATFGEHLESHKVTVVANKLITADFRWAAE